MFYVSAVVYLYDLQTSIAKHFFVDLIKSDSGNWIEFQFFMTSDIRNV